MQFGNKFLCSVLVVMIFCFITSGGCGGSSDDDNGTEQRQNQNQGNNSNTLSTNNTPTTPNNPTNPNTPNTPNNPTSPDNPSNPTAPETPVVQEGLNGTWEGEKYSGSFEAGGMIVYDEQYLDYTTPRTFTITASKNANDDYYSIVFSGEGVTNSGAADSYIRAVFYTKGAANVDSENGEAWSSMPFMGAGNKFEKVSDTVYRMTNQKISNTESDSEQFTTYTILDSSRVVCKFSYHGIVHDDGPDIEMSGDYIVFNIKRVTQ